MRGRVGQALTGAAAAIALLGQVWTPWDVTRLDVAGRLAGSSLAHPLGTDQLGRDLLSMLMAGAGPSLATAVAGVTIALVAGVPLGLLAAARPGLIDQLTTRSLDILFAIPAIVLAILIVAVAGPGADRAAFAIGVVATPVMARVTRAGARPIWTRDFILAARLAGKGRARITLDHVAPAVAGTVAAQVGIQLALALVAESGLSYLGLGVQPPGASWGRMLADGQTLAADAPRLVIWPGLMIVATALGLVGTTDAAVRGFSR